MTFSPMNLLLTLATEGGVPAEHIVAKLAFPIGVLVFCGGVFLLLWSNYGWKKGALIYGVAFGGFCMMLGVFWWFGAPGTPVATGLRNFPGQAQDAYTAKWYPFEPGSERAEFFDVTSDVTADDDLDDVASFQPVAEHLGAGDATEEELENMPAVEVAQGDATQAGDLMVDLFLRREGEDVNLGGQRRAEYAEAGDAALAQQVDDPDAWTQDEPFYTAAIRDEEVRLAESNGNQLSGVMAEAYVNYVEETEGDELGETISIKVDEYPVFAFKQESNLWFPSAVWTGAFGLMFLVSLFLLDRIEQREKKEREEVEEPERLAVPMNQ